MAKYKLGKTFISFGLTAVFLVSCLLTGVVQAQGFQQVVVGNNKFAVELFRKINTDQGEENSIFSPLSLSAALGMTYAGSRGNTAKQMADTMHFGYSQEQFHQDFSTLLRGLGNDEKLYTLNIANALWGQKNYQFDQGFVSLINTYYDGGFYGVDYIKNREESRNLINQWVAEKTNDKIKDLLKASDLSIDTRLVLTNAIYFKGNWALPFNPAKTMNMPFNVRPDQKVTVNMMRQEGNFGYADNKEVQLLELPYAGNDLAMLVLLPHNSSTEFMSSLSYDKLKQWMSQLNTKQVEVCLPRFKLAARYYLENENLLPAMGIKDAFSVKDADFSGMTGDTDLYIAHVIHQAVIDVNEAGTEAAASTAVAMDTKCVLPVFRADKPFVFVILHKPTGSILFMGKVSNPKL